MFELSIAYISHCVSQTTEWSSSGQKAGATLTLSWASPISISQLVFYDRPNVEDQVRTLSFRILSLAIADIICLQVIAGTVTFSDGSSLVVPTLPNAGTALPLYFSAVTTTSLVFTVTSVSSTTSNIGLSELQVYGLASS